MLSKTLRRTDRALSEEDTRKVLARCQWDLSFSRNFRFSSKFPLAKMTMRE
jgi:hypothetical protein